MHKVAVFVGSLRAESINLKFARALARLAEPKLGFSFVGLSDVPIYNEDLWQSPPASVLRLKDDIARADAVLFVTPEYNRSVPAVIKNAIDWGTRPYGQNAWSGKPGAIVGTSTGAAGTAAAQVHLRSILPVLGIILMSQPEVYFVTKPGLIDDNSNITNEDTRKFLANFLDRFAHWIDNFGAANAK